jgi:chromosome segregation ATPase
MPDRETSQTASDTTSTPEEQLAKAKKEVDDAQFAVAQDTQRLAQAQSGLQVLQKQVNDLQQTLGGYDKSQSQRLEDAKATLEQKIINDAKKELTKDVTDKLDGIVKNFDDGLAAQETAVENASKTAGKAADAVDPAKNDLDKKYYLDEELGRRIPDFLQDW